jgi:YidC/Oxa1 family membrane protein insertase
MYDRKTWIVLIVCGGLLAANLYFSAQTQRAKAAEQQRELEQRQANTPAEVQPAIPSQAELTVETPPPSAEEELVILENDQVSFTLTNIGGGIKFAEFKNEFEVGSRTSRVRINRFGSGPIGAIAGAGETLDNIPYAYKAEESIAGKKAVFIARLPSGLVAKKSFTLNLGNEPGATYLMDFDLRIENSTAAALNLNQWSLFLGEASPLYQAEWPQQTGFFRREDGTVHFTDGGSFKGGWFGSAKSIINSPEETIQFAGVTNQFFATVLRPKEPGPTSMWAKSSQVMLPGGAVEVTSVRAGLRLPAVELQPAESKSLQYRIFIGRRHNIMLRRMERYWGEGWGDVMQYGWFWFVSRPLNFLLNTYHGWLDGIARNWSWGLAIILLTITVRFVIWPLHAKSTHTMKRMAKLKPEMDKLKEKYPDDPNKLNTEMMGLYRKFGINPLGGCLPMFIQIPIFFGFYRMLQYAVELRGQGFLWVNDLSQPDTLHTFNLPFALPFVGTELDINILPIIMAITSFLQIKMTPMTGDKMQQRIIMFMPFMFFFFCYNFASALALYWTTQNIFSIGQTWLMSKVPEPELKPVKGAGKSWVQRMAEKQAELQKHQKARQQGGTDGMRDVTPPDKKKRPPRTGG